MNIVQLWKQYGTWLCIQTETILYKDWNSEFPDGKKIAGSLEEATKYLADLRGGLHGNNFKGLFRQIHFSKQHNLHQPTSSEKNRSADHKFFDELDPTYVESDNEDEDNDDYNQGDGDEDDDKDGDEDGNEDGDQEEGVQQEESRYTIRSENHNSFKFTSNARQGRM